MDKAAREAARTRWVDELMRQEFEIEGLPGIATLRSVRAARNSYPIHSGDPEARRRLAQLGIRFPPDDWNQAWLEFHTATRSGLREIRDVLSERIPRPRCALVLEICLETKDGERPRLDHGAKGSDLPNSR
jgi:hypothetical protein